jgi:hypothetical protein
MAVAKRAAAGTTRRFAPRQLGGSVSWFRRELREEASERWNVRGGVAELWFVAPAVGAVFCAGAALHRGLFDFLVTEDSLLEWAQVVGFLGGFVGGGALAVLAFRGERHRIALAYAVFAAASLFVFGEELSWGQRLFGFGTPEPLQEINNQDEVTLHNVVEVRVLMKFFLIFLGLAGAVLPWVFHLRRSRWSALMPPLFTTSAFLLIFGYNAARLIFFPEGFFGWEENHLVGRYGEWPETCLASLTAGFAWLAWRRSVPDARRSPFSRSRASNSAR